MSKRLELRIVASTGGYVVVDKPAGLLSVPGKGDEKQDCVASRVRELFPRCSGPLIVHRLDMDTSGLLVLGLTPAAQANLSRQFELRRVSKSYIALLEGVVAHADHGRVEAAIRPDVDRRPYQIYDWLHGRQAVTDWRVLSFETDRTRVQFEPLTGRTHQLRVHAALPRPIGLGHAIVGDPLYGRCDERLMLHAATLRFRDPDTEKWTEVVSSAPF